MPLRSASRFSVSSLISFISMFHEKNRLTDEQGMSILGMKNVHHYAKYRNFLLSGHFIAQKKQAYAKTERLTQLWKALKKSDPFQVKDLLCEVPPVAKFMDTLKKGRALTTADATGIVNPAAYVTYCKLAEITCAGLQVATGEGIYATPFEPEVEKFTDVAISSYKRLARREKYILTGFWLETLAKKHGIHPLIARDRFNQAKRAGLLGYDLDGPKPDFPLDKHTMHFLTVGNGMPMVQKIKLYHGDFLIPNKSSVTVKLLF